MAVRLSASRVGRPLPSERFLILISVSGCVDSRTIVRLEGLDQLKKSSDLMGNRNRDLPAYSIEQNEIHPMTCSDRGVVYDTDYRAPLHHNAWPPRWSAAKVFKLRTDCRFRNVGISASLPERCVLCRNVNNSYWHFSRFSSVRQGKCWACTSAWDVQIIIDLKHWFILILWAPSTRKKHFISLTLNSCFFSFVFYFVFK
jgi:hypothetical protein